MSQTVLSAKLPSELVADLGELAARRGTSRNALVREALEAAVDGRVEWLGSDANQRRRLRRALERDRQRLTASV